MEEWDVNANNAIRVCCCRKVCQSCNKKIETACPLCRIPRAEDHEEDLARLRRHAENEVPEAITFLGTAYREGWYGLVKSDKKAAKIFKRAVAFGDVDAMVFLGVAYYSGRGVKLDWKKAKRLQLMAADRGCALGQCNVGEICEVKEGDIGEARKWYALSAAQGFKPAFSALARLDAVLPTTAST
jgi:TPR repeat protein